MEKNTKGIILLEDPIKQDSKYNTLVFRKRPYPCTSLFNEVLLCPLYLSIYVSHMRSSVYGAMEV